MRTENRVLLGYLVAFGNCHACLLVWLRGQGVMTLSQNTHEELSFGWRAKQDPVPQNIPYPKRRCDLTVSWWLW